MMPLDGVQVLDLSYLLPGPYATMILADFGAEVVKVERPGGGDPGRTSEPTSAGVSTRHRHVNRNKRSVVLDLKSPAGLERFLTLAAEADVLVEGFRPGALAKLGLSFEQLHGLNPRLVYCSLNGFGSSGPMRDVPAHDLNFMALAGLLPSRPSDAGPVSLPGAQYADLAGGSLRAVIGILLALRAREQTGQGQHVDVSLAEGAFALNVERLAYWNQGMSTQVRETRLTGRYPCYDLYATADDRLMAVAATESKFWRALCSALGVPHLADHQYAVGDEGRRTRTELAEVFLTRTMEEWRTRLEGLPTCCTPVLEVGEAVDTIENARPGSLWTSEGDVQPGPVIRLSDTPAALRRPAPSLGHDTDTLLEGRPVSS